MSAAVAETKTTPAASSMRRRAAIVGVLYILGTVAGVMGITVTKPYFGAPDYLAAIAWNADPVILGALLTLAMGLVLAMIPVLMYPVLKRQNETLALGYVVFRGALETATYIVTAVSWLLTAAMSRAPTSDVAALQPVAAALIDPRATTAVTAIFFITGALMFYSMLYRSAIVPRWISVWGLLAAAPYMAASLLALFGVIGSNSSLETLLYLPMAAQEMVLAVWLIVKGFRPEAISALYRSGKEKQA